tara:strand:- start:5 stop:1741 length:1737 start_codon:yes stop_codon:yes gene_type:complete
MPDRKRRPPSGKIPPGTPHPTKAYTVRGYDGRWISRKAFLAAKRKRDNSTAKLDSKPKSQKPKGGSLVKRGSSAVTKVSNKVGNLLKIRKGDKGIVRGIKDTYKLGKDTRKSANALYKAGKITREVHDKLVKGGKEFVKGTVESGKATRRAFERLKPGGKIVKSKGNKLTKYTKPASKIVRSPGGKLYRPQGGKLAVRPTDKGGQLVKTPKVKTKAKVTPKVESARRVSAREKLELAKKGVNKDTAFNRKYKVEGSSTNPRRVTKGGKVISEVNQGKGVKPKKLVKQAKTLGKKAVMQAKRLKNVKGYGKVVKGLKIGGKVGGQALKVLGAADITGGGWRTTGNLIRRIRKKPLKAGGAIGGATTQYEINRIKAQNAYLKEHGSLKGFNKAHSRWNPENRKTDNQKTDNQKTNNITNKKKVSSSSSEESQVSWKNLKKSNYLDKKPESTTGGTKKSSGSTVHTRHYKTGERLGVLTRTQRRAYDKEAAGRTFESEVAKYAESSGHGKSHLRETLYKSSVRKKKTPVSKGKSLKKVEITKDKNKFKVDPKDLPKGKVKMKDGSIVDRSSLYKKKKKNRI